jgi:lipoprotein-anchoring transpeptidase ErfK/SrfK
MQFLFLVDETGTNYTHSSGLHGRENLYGSRRGFIGAIRKREIQSSAKSCRMGPNTLGLLYYPNLHIQRHRDSCSLAMAVYPASHGCIRIPMFASKELSELTPVGTEVIVYDD